MVEPLPPPPPPPPPQAAIMRASNNPTASGRVADRDRPTWGLFRHRRVHAITARTKANINKPLRLSDKGGTGGRGRERGTSTEAAVVLTVTVTLVVELPAVTGFGETVQVASEGAPTQVKFTVPENPPSPPILKL